MESLHERLLKHYKMTEEDFNRECGEPSFPSIPRIDNDAAVVDAIKRIRKAIENKENILIFGDYDCDGIMSTSILLWTFNALHKHVSTFIPSRYADGYGLTMEQAPKIADKGYKLVILLDNGVSAFDGVSFLVSKGIDVIIIDHHELGASLPPCYALIHPDTLKYGDVPVSAGYLTFLFSIALLRKVEPYLLILGAISTISDMMPVKSYNKTIIALALRMIKKHQFRTISYLCQKTKIDEKIISMDIVPLINSVGRIVEDSTINKLPHYFAGDCPRNEPAIASFMKEANLRRKNATKSALANLIVDENEDAIVVLANLKEGLNGLLANRILIDHHKPVAVFSPSSTNKDEYVGSMRSENGFSIIEAQKELEDILSRCGGHACAGGCSLKKSNFEAFKERFNAFAKKHPSHKDKPEPIELSLSECTLDSYKEIRSFAPFGHDYDEPTFIIRNIPADGLQFHNKNGTLLTPLGHGVEIKSFSFTKDDFKGKEYVDLTGKFGLNEWNGRIKLQFVCEKE